MTCSSGPGVLGRARPSPRRPPLPPRRARSLAAFAGPVQGSICSRPSAASPIPSRLAGSANSFHTSTWLTPLSATHAPHSTAPTAAAATAAENHPAHAPAMAMEDDQARTTGSRKERSARLGDGAPDHGAGAGQPPQLGKGARGRGACRIRPGGLSRTSRGRACFKPGGQVQESTPSRGGRPASPPTPAHLYPRRSTLSTLFIIHFSIRHARTHTSAPPHPAPRTKQRQVRLLSS